jgi:hypothetical protein
MGFNADAVAIAYDRMLFRTGKFVWNYMDTIIKSWHDKNLHEAQEILEKERISSRNDTTNKSKTQEQKFGAPNHEEIRRMERILNKIKQD